MYLGYYREKKDYFPVHELGCQFHSIIAVKKHAQKGNSHIPKRNISFRVLNTSRKIQF